MDWLDITTVILKPIHYYTLYFIHFAYTLYIISLYITVGYCVCVSDVALINQCDC